MGFLDFQTIQKFGDAEYPTDSLEDSAGLCFTVVFIHCIINRHICIVKKRS